MWSVWWFLPSYSRRTSRPVTGSRARGLRWSAANYIQRRVNNRRLRDAANNRSHRQRSALRQDRDTRCNVHLTILLICRRNRGELKKLKAVKFCAETTIVTSNQLLQRCFLCLQHTCTQVSTDAKLSY